MKKTKKSSGRKSSSKKSSAKRSAGRRRKPIMRHSREGVKARSRKRAAKRGAAKPRRKAAPKRAAESTAKRSPKVRAKQPAKTSGAATGASRSRGPRPWETDPSLAPRSGSRGIGGAAAGQSGDLEEIPRDEDVDSESVEELLEEGQAFEAGVVEGVEEADEEDDEIRTREVPMDDVPDEYLDEEE